MTAHNYMGDLGSGNDFRKKRTWRNSGKEVTRLLQSHNGRKLAPIS